MRPRGLDLLGVGLVDESAVGAEDDHEFFLRGVADDVVNVRPEQRLAAGEDEKRVGVHFGDLVDDPETLLGVEFVFHQAAAECGVEVAMVAIEVASFR